MTKNAAVNGPDQVRLRRMLMGCQETYGVLARSEAEAAQIAKLRFLQRIDAAAEKMNCKPDLVDIVKGDIDRLVMFAVLAKSAQPKQDYVSKAKEKRAQKGELPVAERAIDVLATLRAGYDKILAEMIGARQQAQQKVAGGGSRGSVSPPV